MAYNTTMPSGYDYEFVQEVPDDVYICSICHLVMRKPVQTKCGHQFCKECLEEANKRNPQCPEDREPLTAQDIFEDKAMGRRIMSLVIKCQEQACIWQGELRYIENHENGCDYKIVDCDNESCSVRKPRCEMVGHVQDDCLYRIVSCPHCMNAYKFCLLEEHTSECPQCPVSCPNNCGKTVTREQITSHTSTECPLTFVPCNYQNIGCAIKVQRQLLNDHIENHVKQHLTIAVEKILSIQNQMDRIPTIMTKDDERRYSFIWKVRNFSEELETAKQSGRYIIIYSEPFYTDKYGYKLKLKLYPIENNDDKDPQVSVYLIIMRGEYDEVLTWPFDWKLNFILIDQKPNPLQRNNIERHLTPDKSGKAVQRKTTDNNFGIGIELVSHEALATQNYVVNGTLFVELQLEKPQQVDTMHMPQLMTKDDENRYSFIWKVRNFSEELETAKQSGRDIELYSEPFYTHKYGYKLKLRLDPNGNRGGKGTHVSVYLIVMRGEYDVLLTWPFDWKVRLILMDQKPNPSQRKNNETSFTPDKSLDNYQRPTTDENTGIGPTGFVSHETLATENYVVDGTLFLKLELEKPK